MSYELGRVEKWHRLILIFTHCASSVPESRTAHNVVQHAWPGKGAVLYCALELVCVCGRQVMIYYSLNGRDVQSKQMFPLKLS